MTKYEMPHEHWEELVAGYVLGALEPDEEQQLADHLEHCNRCSALAADYQNTVADLAYLSDEPGPPPQLWNKIHAALGEEAATAPVGAYGTPPAPDRLTARKRVRLRAHGDRAGRTTSARVLVAAAAIAALLGVGSWQAVDHLGGDTHSPAVVAACAAGAGCEVVHLSGPGEQADLLVRGDHAELVPTGLSPLDPGEIYVLWQIAPGGPATGMAAFRVSGAHDVVAARAPLVRPADATTFAISRETGTAIPAKPSSTIATSHPNS